MTDLVARLRLEADGGDQAAAEPAKVEAALEAVGPAGAAADRGARQAAGGIDQLGNVATATARDMGTLYDEMQRDFYGVYNQGARSFIADSKAAQNAAKTTVTHFDTLYDATSKDFSAVWTAGATKFVADSGKVQAAAKLNSHEMLNMGRQFADVGVTAAMGMNPLMILVQQGPQIADTLATAGSRGVTASMAFRQVAAAGWAMVAPLAPFVVGFAAVAAVIGGTAALAARSLTNENKNLVASLGLTEKQMERLKEKGVDTGVTIGDVFKGTFNYIAGAVAPLLAPVGKFFNELFDNMSKWAMGAARNVVGTLVGAYSAVMATWKMLPAAMADIAVSTANNVVAAIERMINAAIEKYNRLLPAIRALMAATGNTTGASILTPMQSVALPRYQNDNAGAAAGALDAGQAAFTKGFGQGSAWVDAQAKGLVKSILDATGKRLLKEAGDADKARPARQARAPRDQSDERAAQIAQLIAQALGDELQARLSISKDVSERASIQKQMIATELAGKQAALARQAASIADDKGLSSARKEELTAQLGLVEMIQARTAAALTKRVDDEASAEIARQQLELQTAQREAQIDLLGSQADLTRSTFARNVIEARILALQQQIERSKLEEVIASADSAEHEKEMARARLAVLDQIHQNQRAQLGQQTRLVDALGEAADSVRDFKSAWRRKDWAGIFDNLARTIQTIEAAWAAKGPAGGMMSAGGAIATMVGGRAGNAIGTGLGIAGLGASMSGMLAGGLSGTIGAIGGSLGISMAAQVGAVNAIAGIAPLLGPIGLAAGALYAAAKIFNVGGKPTNAGAGYDLVTGQLSGNKRTTETENAAKSAADAILQGMKVLQGAGVKTDTSVKGLVIGTRDESQIYMSDGRTVTSAVGNAAAAVDAAMRAVLQGATYTSETQKKLVESAIAAGKGFDEVAAILDGFAQSQSLVKGIDDAILQLTDPKAWAIEELKRNQTAFRDSLKAASDAGNLTADEYAKALLKLDTLEGLQLEDTLKRFVDSIEETADALKARAKTLGQSVNDRILELTNPQAFGLQQINREIDAKIAEANPLIAAGELGAEFLVVLEQLRQLEIGAFLGNLANEVDETAKAFQDARPRLLSWLDEMRAGATSELSPKAQREEALRQYQRQLALARGGDKDALGNLTSYADRLLEADRNATSSASARLALRNQVAGQVEGLAARGVEASPAAAIASLQPTLAQIAAAGAAELATITAGGKSVVISNLPSMQAMYGDLIGKQTDRLVAANDRSREEIVAATKATADRLEAALAGLAGRLDGALAAQAQAAAAQAAEMAAGLQRLAEEQRLSDLWQRANA